MLIKFIHPLQGCSLGNLIKLYKNNGINLKYFWRILFVSTVATIVTPTRAQESLLYDKRIKSVSLDKPPIFIIGHWRSGTTLLHDLLAQDPQFCYITGLQAIGPHSYILLNFFRHLKLTVKRPMDEMLLGLNNTQEDEFALANMTASSAYHGLFYFPKDWQKYLKYLSFANVNQSEIDLWKNDLLFLYKKTCFMHNRQILSKNPPFTSKIKYLLELFPDAKFIHIYRNPYLVYVSSMNFFKKMHRQFSLQNIPSDFSYEKMITDLYSTLMKTFFSQKDLIPKGNYTEIKFEALEAKPLYEIEKIYTDLNLGDFSKIKNGLQRYIDSLQGYKKNSFQMPTSLVDKIYSELFFTIDKWGYQPG